MICKFFVLNVSKTFSTIFLFVYWTIEIIDKHKIKASNNQQACDKIIILLLIIIISIK